MSEELIALVDCPFCGATGDELILTKPGQNLGLHNIGYRVACSDGCSTWGPMECSEDEAIAAWNTRAIAKEPHNGPA